MAEHSSMHLYLNWAKERLDEMDATLASLEAKTGQVQAESKAKAEQAIADLKKQRDEFQAGLRKQAEAGEAAWERTRADLESQWHGFEAQVKTYFGTVAKQAEQQQATFREVADAQLKAWREATEKVLTAAAQVGATARSEIDAAVEQMQADAAQADARLQKLKQAGGQSWAALSGALAESRKAFDEANRAAWEAFKRASRPAA